MELPSHATLSAVRFGPAAGDLLLTFAHGPRLAVPAALLPPLRRLTGAQLAALEVGPEGRSVVWPGQGLVLPLETILPLVFGSAFAGSSPGDAGDPGVLGTEGAGLPGVEAPPSAWTEQDVLVAWARVAGSRRSSAKAEAARRNGRKGGRPRRTPATQNDS